MNRTWIERLQLETKVVIQLAERDKMLRVIASIVITMIVSIAGNPEDALKLFIVIMAYELLGKFAFRKTSDLTMRVTTSRVIAVLALSMTSLTVLLYPAIFLMQVGSTPMLLVAMTWLFGTLMHVSNNYAGLTVYRWCMVLPPFAVTIAMMMGTADHSYVWTGTTDLMLALGMFSMFCFNIYHAMSQHENTLLDLETARNDAQARLWQLEHLSRHDPLTGLINRGAFDASVQQHLENALAGGKPLTVFLCDLDGFKPINDSYSHAAGDAILREVAVRLLNYFQSTDLVARLGGDEFAVVARDISSESQAMHIGKEVAQLLRQPVRYGQRELAIGCSIGITRSDDDTRDATQLLNQADQAMYRAKEDSAVWVQMYDRTTFPVRATLDDRTILKKAMDDGEIRPFYQPKVNLITGQIQGLEALSRWQHPRDGMIMPGKFIPLVNELSLQAHFLFHTLRCTLADVEAMLAQGLDPGQVSVNLTEITLATISGRETLKQIISEYPKALVHLTFEVTEDIFIARSGTIIQESIMQFRRMGVRISLDDFGTGFASFQHLRELEFDELKLDTAFVQALGKEPSAQVLVKAFLDIGHGLEVDIVAEGVETDAQRDLLIDMGCDNAQGFLFCKAVPLTDICNRLRAQQQPAAPQYETTAA